jgi:hypothetical protein
LLSGGSRSALRRELEEAAMVDVERRKQLRHRTLKSGLIAFNHASTIECRVRNLSSIGACLEVAGPLGIPDEFLLLLDRNQLRKNCRVIWRRSTRLGVEFVFARSGQPQPAAA